MATTINLNLQSQVQENNRHVIHQTRSLLTTFSKVPWKASKLKHPSDCYQYSTRQTNNALLPLTVGHRQPHSQSVTTTNVTIDKISLISHSAQLQPRPPSRRCAATVPRHKCVSSNEPYLYSDPLGDDDRAGLSEFYLRVSELSQLEEETLKWEELQNKTHCRPSYNNSSSRLSRRPSSEKQLVTARPEQTDHSIPALVITESPSKLQSPTHCSNSLDVHSDDHSGDGEVVSTAASPTHSETNNSQSILSAPVILTNGKLSNSDCQQARHHLRRSFSQDHVSPRKHTRSRCKLPQRSGSATLLTASSSSTSVSSTCSERSHIKHNRANSHKKKHKK